MARDEHARHQLYTRLEEILGTEPATTLMASLPPVDWTEVATKRDLADLRADLGHELHTELTERFAEQNRFVLTTVLASNATMAGVIVAALAVVG